MHGAPMSFRFAGLTTEVEFHIGRFFRTAFSLKVWLGMKAEHTRKKHGRHLADAGVEILHHLVEATSLDCNAVFGALQLRLQITKSGARLKIGIIFRNHQQALQSTAKGTLCFLKFLKLLRGLRCLARINGHAPNRCAGIDDSLKRRLFEIRRALHGLDEVWHEVSTTLVLVGNLRPSGINALLFANEAVVSGNTAKNECHGNCNEYQYGLAHDNAN